MRFYEKLIIMIVLFLGVSIGTAGIIGVYVGTTKTNNNHNPNSVVLENINLF